MEEKQAPSKKKTALWVLIGAVFAVGVALLVMYFMSMREVDAPVPDEEFDMDVEQVQVVEVKEFDPKSMKNNSIAIPSLGIEAEFNATGRSSNGKEMVIPTDLSKLGLWDEGVVDFSADEGVSLLAGHNIYNGKRGVLYDLYKVGPGDPVFVKDGKGTVTKWAVSSLRAEERSDIHRELFLTGGPRVLSLVTCGGQADNGEFLNNVIVEAIRVK